MPDRKEKKTKIGKFLQSINFSKVAEVTGNIISGNWKGALDVIADKDNGMTDEERAFAITVMQLDIQEMESVSERWSSDMKSDSLLSKNVRPLSLIFLTVTTVILIYLDSFNEDISVPSEWIELLKSLLLGIYIAYFGSRGIEKYKSIGK
tara:strand:- start:1063 stop:1512 length:450 start_codon:yes stop_codon:yes gene_type:complete